MLDRWKFVGQTDVVHLLALDGSASASSLAHLAALKAVGLECSQVDWASCAAGIRPGATPEARSIAILRESSRACCRTLERWLANGWLWMASVKVL